MTKKKYAFSIEVQAKFSQDVYLEVDETKTTVEEAERVFEKCIRGLDDVNELVYRARGELPDGATITGYDKWDEVSGDPHTWDIEFDDIRELYRDPLEDLDQ